MKASHRTEDLTPVSGFAGWIRNLRYKEAWRQGLAVILILLFTVTANVPIESILGLGIALALLGSIFRFYASGYINKNDELATGGPYALVRHPLYTGNILSVSGFAIASGNWWAIVVALLFFWFYYPPAVRYEDQKLHRLFGESWTRWAERTPALLPTFQTLGNLRDGHWSARLSFRRNGEIVIAAFVILCVVGLISQTF